MEEDVTLKEWPKERQLFTNTTYRTLYIILPDSREIPVPPGCTKDITWEMERGISYSPS